MPLSSALACSVFTICRKNIPRYLRTFLHTRATQNARVQTPCTASFVGGFRPGRALSGRAHRLTWTAFAPVRAAGAVPDAERAGRARPGFRGGDAALTRSH